MVHIAGHQRPISAAKWAGLEQPTGGADAKLQLGQSLCGYQGHDLDS